MVQCVLQLREDLMLVTAHSSRRHCSSSNGGRLLLGLKSQWCICECRNSGAGKNLSTMKSLRVLRVLRPLKTINRVPKLKVRMFTFIMAEQPSWPPRDAQSFPCESINDSFSSNSRAVVDGEYAITATHMSQFSPFCKTLEPRQWKQVTM